MKKNKNEIEKKKEKHVKRMHCKKYNETKRMAGEDKMKKKNAKKKQKNI